MQKYWGEATNGSLLTHGPPIDIVLEAQLFERENYLKVLYKEMLVGIGLDSPTPSVEVGWDNCEWNPKEGQSAHGLNTPIRNSAVNLMALEQHALTPKQVRYGRKEANHV